MINQFSLPGIACPKCGGKLALHVATRMVSITELKIRCEQCDYEEDILEKSGEKFEGSKKEVQRIAKEIADSIVKLRDTLPKDRDEWVDVVKNPRHPFTAALLTGFAIFMMELSGFGIFMAVTWILGNLILNPVGWVLVPIVVAIAFYFRGYFNRSQLTNLKQELTDLEQQRDTGILTEAEFEAAREKLLANYFK
jgi:hypothetical protein